MGRMIFYGLVFLILVKGSLVAAAEHSVGFFKTVTGEVAVVRAEVEIGVTPGMRFQAGDTIVTGMVSSTGIVFDDGTVLTLGAGTELEVTSYMFQPDDQEYDFSLFMKRGEMIYNSGKLKKLAPEKVNLKTPRATVGVRGTRFILAVK